MSLNGNLVKLIGLFIRMCQNSVGLNYKWELGKMDRALIGMWPNMWVIMGTRQKSKGINRNSGKVLIRTWIWF